MSKNLNTQKENLIFPKILDQINNTSYNIIQYMPMQYNPNFYDSSISKVVQLSNVLINDKWILLENNSYPIAYAHVFSLYNNNYIVYDIDNVKNIHQFIDSIENEIVYESIFDKNIDSYSIYLSSKNLQTSSNSIHVYIGLNKFIDVAEYYNHIPFHSISKYICNGFMKVINIKQRVTIRISPIINFPYKNTNIIILSESRKENSLWLKNSYLGQTVHSEISDGQSVTLVKPEQKNFQLLARA